MNKGLISINSTDPKRNISVYGSGSAAEEVDGKVLFSLFDDSLIGGAGDSVKTTSQVPEQIINDFADEILVGLTLQYREPLEADITFTTNEPASDFASAYGRGFNQTFSNNLNSSVINLETTRILIFRLVPLVNYQGNLISKIELITQLQELLSV